MKLKLIIRLNDPKESLIEAKASLITERNAKPSADPLRSGRDRRRC